jgi:hypothetical protein
VSEISNRATDSFDNSAKSGYRARHLEVIREHAPELWREGNEGLRGAWLELMGATGWKTLEMLMKKGALEAESFVGVDLDVKRIDDYKARYPAARWLAGDLLDLVQRPELEDVSVVHFDGYEAVGSSRLQHVGEQLVLLLRRAIEDFGAGVLIWNADLDACRLHRQPAATALRAHAVKLGQILHGALEARREISAETLLGLGAERAVTDPSFVGSVGVFEVYRGRPGGHRMACLRAVLR